MNINFNTKYIILWGDLHSVDRAYSILKYKQNNLDNQTVLMLGDFGLGFAKREYDEVRLNKLNEVCRNRNILLYVIRGNHDCPEFWNRNYCFSNLFLVPDYSSAQFPNNKKALLVGGGISIDRPARREGLDYWADEITVYQKINNKYDYLFSHDTANYFNFSTESLWGSPYQDFLRDDTDLFNDALNQRNVLGQIISDTQCKYVFHGHFHRSIKEEKNGVTCQCLDIEELFEFDSEKY